MTNDSELLEEYVRNKSEDAFAILLKRHVNLVYSAALRQVRCPQLAQDVTQSTFMDLAKQAHRLTSGIPVTSWLFQVTRRTAIDVIRRESRRQAREQAAFEQQDTSSGAASWDEVAPVLDEAMAALEDSDRSALLLRFFENKSLREVGHALGISDDAAQKRVSRAVERLRHFLSGHGVSAGPAALTALVSANAIQSAPAGLAYVISQGIGSALPAAAAGSKAVALTAMQKGIFGAIVLATIGTGIYTAREKVTGTAPAPVATQLSVTNDVAAATLPSAAVPPLKARDIQAPPLRPRQRPSAPVTQPVNRVAATAIPSPAEARPLLTRAPAGGAFAENSTLTRFAAEPGTSRVQIDGTSTIHDWTIITTLVAGTLELDSAFLANPRSLTGSVPARAEVSIPVRTLKSGHTGMDNVVYQAMQMATYQKIQYHLQDLVLKEVAEQGDTLSFDSTGQLTIHGVTNTVRFPVTMKIDRNGLRAEGTVKLKMTDYNIVPPEPKILVMAPIKTGDEVRLSFNWLTSLK